MLEGRAELRAEVRVWDRAEGRAGDILIRSAEQSNNHSVNLLFSV